MRKKYQNNSSVNRKYKKVAKATHKQITAHKNRFYKRKLDSCKGDLKKEWGLKCLEQYIK